MSNKDVEQISSNDISVFQNDIEYYISMFCEEENIKDIRKISQSVFNALMMYINAKYIKPSGILKKNDNYNSYDVSKVESLCDYYIFLCNKYDKECSIVGFSYFTGIERSVFYDWMNDYSNKYKYNDASSPRSYIAKKLHVAREDSLSDKLLTGKNPVGVLGILNHFYGWNMPGVKESATKSAGTLADLQKKAGLLSNNSASVPDDLTQKQVIELSDNSTQ